MNFLYYLIFLDLPLYSIIILPFLILFTLFYFRDPFFKNLISKKWFKVIFILYLLFFGLGIITLSSTIPISIIKGESFLGGLARIYPYYGYSMGIFAIIIFLVCFIKVIINIIKHKTVYNKLKIIIVLMFVFVILSLPNFLFIYSQYVNKSLSKAEALKLGEFAMEHSFFNLQRYGFAINLDHFDTVRRYLFSFPIVPKEAMDIEQINQYGGFKKLLEKTVSTQEMMCNTYHRVEDCKNLASLYLWTKQYDKAIELPQKHKSLDKQPNIFVSDAYVLRKDYDKAIEFVKQNQYMGKISKESILAQIYAGKGDFNKALEYADKIVESDSNRFLKTSLKTTIYNKMGDDKSALAEFTSKVKRKNKNEYKKFILRFDDIREMQLRIDELIK